MAEIWVKIQIKLFKLLKESIENIISVEILDLLIPKKIPDFLKILHFLATREVFLDPRLPSLCSAPARLGGFILPAQHIVIYNSYILIICYIL